MLERKDTMMEQAHAIGRWTQGYHAFHTLRHNIRVPRAPQPAPQPARGRRQGRNAAAVLGQQLLEGRARRVLQQRGGHARGLGGERAVCLHACTHATGCHAAKCCPDTGARVRSTSASQAIAPTHKPPALLNTYTPTQPTGRLRTCLLDTHRPPAHLLAGYPSRLRTCLLDTCL